MIKGVTITLKKKIRSGADGFNRPVYSTTDISVDNVLVGQPSSDDISNAQIMYGKTIAYTLYIPKGDTNVWEDTTVVLPEPFSGTYHTVGYPEAYIPANIPPGISWNKRISIERSQNG